MTRDQVFRVRWGLVKSPPDQLLAGEDYLLKVEDLEPIDADLDPTLGQVTLDHRLIERVFEEALKLGMANDTSDQWALDRWLAPRIHTAVRVPRRLAADRRFWSWIAIKFARGYVHQRFSEGGVVNAWRYTGDHLRNAVSRLWWAAELLRNAGDYSAATLSLQRVRTAQFALELKYSWYRPAAIAFAQLAEDPEERLTDAEMSAMSVRANAYLPLAPLEAIGYEEGPDELDQAWWTGLPTAEEILGDDDPEGPRDGAVAPESIKRIREWFLAVLAEVRSGSVSDQTGVGS